MSKFGSPRTIGFRGFIGSVSLVSRGLRIEIVLGERIFRRRAQEATALSPDPVSLL
jgi:hypothetical protein